MQYYIVVKMRFVGELYDVSGPYDSRQEAEDDFDIQHLVWELKLLSFLPRVVLSPSASCCSSV